MKTKHYAFLYYNGESFIEDEALITREHADALWDKHKADFTKECEKEDSEAEMCMWENMESDIDYRHVVKNAVAREIVMQDGVAYMLNPV
tara:strand:- start:13823 stop:14092 length:270 start_codon:yes stop_codon:yes gene_type:complete